MQNPSSKLPVVQDATVRWIEDHWSKGSSSAVNSGLAFLRIPFDYAVSHRPGCRFGPQKIVEHLNSYSLYCADKRVSFAELPFHDFGSVEISNSFTDSYRRIREAVASLPSGVVPVLLGGDHSISDPIIRGIHDRHPGGAGLIVFDSHFDSRDPVAGKEHSGHWMKTIQGALDYRRAVQLGINAPIYSEAYMRSAERNGILVRTPYEIRQNGWQTTIRDAILHASSGVAGVYLSVDIDCIDQSEAPGTSVPNANGLRSSEIIDAVFCIASTTNIVGFDIVEVNPLIDRDDMTSRLAALIVHSLAAGISSRTYKQLSSISSSL